MNKNLNRRTFLKTMGSASASVFLPQLFNSCQLKPKQRPNILWIEVEDISPLMSCYGYNVNPTPNLDQLAKNGVLFKNTFMPAPVCSPCRSALITGMMQTTIGVHNHHSSRSEETAINLPDHVKTLPELFKETGYFTFNHGKDDYNFWYDRENLYTGEYRTHKLYGKFGNAIDWNAREHVISARDRCDYTIDRIRSVRTKRFRYIRNFFPDRPYMQPNYRDEWEITQLMRKLHATGKLNPTQDRFWSDERPAEELYDIENDPHEIHNLADNPDYAEELKRHRDILNKWIKETDDKGQYTEDKPNLKYMYDWWGEKCINPEYDVLKKQ